MATTRQTPGDYVEEVTSGSATLIARADDVAVAAATCRPDELAAAPECVVVSWPAVLFGARGSTAAWTAPAARRTVRD